MGHPREVRGELLGERFPPTIETLLQQGATFLTRAFHAAGSLAPDNRVTAITHSEEFFGGGMGRKLLLSVAYARDDAGLHRELFVKFPRDFGDPLRELFGPLMAPEVRLALLSRRADFPVAVPKCYFAEYDSTTTSGILITERIAFGRGDIEPAFEKCLDHELADPLDHYRALTRCMARLAASHKAGLFGSEVEDAFPFDPEAVDAGSRIPYSAAQLQDKLDTLRRFAAAHPQLFPAALRDPGFLQRFADEAALVLRHELAIRRYLNGKADYIALCHWNMNLDNAWFWRAPGGEIEAGLFDWGSVGQMNVAQAFYGMTCAAETGFLDAHRRALVRLFVAEYQRWGGPALDVEDLSFLIRLSVAVLGIAWILDAPSLITAELGDVSRISGRDDPALRANFLARCQLQLLVVFLNEWRKDGVGDALRRFDAEMAGAALLV